MRHRQRYSKEYSLLSKAKLTSQYLLHSDKSTYFSKGYKLLSSAQIKFNTIPLVGCSIALLGLGCMLINPMSESSANNAVYAIEPTNGDTENNEVSILSDTKSLSLTLDTNLPNNNTITQLVDSNGPEYITVDFTVEANGVKEYDVYALADTNNLKGSLQGDLIQSINASTVGSNIEAKQWGYALTSGTGYDPANLTYLPIQTTVSEGLSWTSESATSTQYYTLAFAANLTGAKADHYKTDITLSAVIPAQEVIELEDPIGFGLNDMASNNHFIYNMQDMDATVCANTPIGVSGTLRDTRDDKVYWVTKLADNNCWMTQNLALDIPTEGLKAADTDITTDWTEANALSSGHSTPARTLHTGETLVSNEADGINAVISYNFGKYIDAMPTSSQRCSGLFSTGYSDCNPSKIVNVSNLKPSNDTLFTGVYDYTDDTDFRYNSHFLLGNYYSWGAATAGQVKTLTNANPTQSICPKGWTLPSSDQYAAMFNSYGEYKTGTAFYGNQDLRLAPTYLFQGGGGDPEYIRYLGSHGFYVTSSIRNTDENNTYYAVGISATSVIVSNGAYRSELSPMRCIAR